MIVIDTSAMIDSLSGARNSAAELNRILDAGERIVAPSLVLFEWWRGPRTVEELEIQQVLFPKESSLSFGAEEALIASELYRSVRKPRGREIDIAIAAVVIWNEASLWTLNPRDFSDLPGLELVD